MAIEDIGKNALQVLEKRYLAKDAEGNHTEDVAGLFRRVAAAVAAADRNYDENADTAALADSFYELMTSLAFFAKLSHADECGPPVGAAFGLLCAACGGQHGGDFRDGEKRRPHPQIRRRHGLFLLPPAAERAAPVNSTGGVASGPISFMQRVQYGYRGREAGRHPPRGEHGHPAGGPSRYPGIHRLQKGRTRTSPISIFRWASPRRSCRPWRKTEDYDLIDPHDPAPGGQAAAPGSCLKRSWTRAWRNGEPGIIFLDRLNRDNVVPMPGGDRIHQPLR